MSGSYVVRALAVVLATAFIINHSHAQSGGDYAVTERGPDWKVLQKTTVENGTNRIHRYTELATGMHYKNASGQWAESREQITILPNGGAAATQGRHKVYFPSDIYNGVLEVVTPDGRHLRSRPLGVSYDDGSNTIFIATLKHAQGYLTSSNQVTYRDAFEGIKADLVATYRRNGFECDLVFRTQPPTPGDYGLDEEWSTLQMVTEFFNTADPEQIPAASDEWYGLQDSTLKFGKLTMKQGKAFAIKGTNSVSPRLLGGEGRSEGATPVYKRWLNLEGRKFLIEELPLEYLAEDLSALPMTAGILKPASGTLKFATNKRQFPPAHEFITETNQILLAAADFAKEPGVVLDYTTVDSDQSAFTFQAGETYLVTGPVTLGNGSEDKSSLIFQGGAVIKFTASAGSGISFDYLDANYETDQDHPVILTSKDDNSIGTLIADSTWPPTILTNVTFLGGLVENELENFYFNYAGTAVNAGDPITFKNCRFYNCQTAIKMSVGGPAIYNCLFSGCSTVVYFDNTWYEGGEFWLTCVDVTADSGTIFMDFADNVDFYYITVINSLFTRFTTATLDVMQSYGVDGFYDNESSFEQAEATCFKSSANASYYLTSNSPYRDVGSVNFDFGWLGTDQMTTYTPQDGGSPDNDGMPDLGYHYPINEDSDYDGLPDWWEWHWFGNFSMSGTNLDFANTDHTFGYDYSNRITPTVFRFDALMATNLYVNTSQPVVQLDVAGTPYYIATLIDDSNLSNAVWQTYSGSSVTVNLGSVQGWHNVYIGLRGHGDEPINAVWQGKRLKLDLTPPALFVTSPTNTTVDIPMIQLQGFSPEALSSISYDLTNAAGLQANQQILVLNQTYDMKSFEFTTNTFQAYDVVLTNGVNTFSFHATDLAGNTTTASYSMTLDYAAKTNPPSIQITWPQNGTEISGSRFTVDGQVNDATITVTAVISDANGNTNSIRGLVERTGKFWVENLPLNGGTNAVTLAVTDAAGNMTTTNFNVIRSTLTFTVNPISDPPFGNPQQLWQPTVNISGNISDASYAVWVNGVKGHNYGNGWWSASNVPVDSGGTATFTATAYAPNEQQPDDSYGN